ncbi:class I SAM-dependent methyltransferase [uncultured Ornithinimicrobium sp.]|uniref:class I SAM-dependent methyltransferase n=1 Tax=uncultured Ornithinimicrobium sp. TaxID=259307 RepID=UPI0025977CBB|nr:class I SAM-dependent methyltransferase [uncultured Ornithinimicrobium sp.]
MQHQDEDPGRRAASLLADLHTGPGRAVLDGLPPYDEAAVLALTARLRDQGVPAEVVAAALTQSRLRARARRRLGDLAETLLLTEDGLEQATRPAVAVRHAERFRASGVGHVWDLGCGLGLDAIALAGAGLEVTALDRDPEVVAAARANLSGHPRARVVLADAGSVTPEPDDGVWFDPARRAPGVADVHGRTRRRSRLAELSPSWEHVQLVSRRAAAAGAKLSPGFPVSEVPDGVEAEWVSLDGDVLECALWWGGAAGTTGRSAVVGVSPGAGSSTDAAVRWHVVRAPEQDPGVLADARSVGPFLAEPDRAVVAARLTGALAATVDGAELDTGVGYVTAGRVHPLPWARWYAVQEVLPLRARPVRAWLRAQGAGRVTLKKRGVGVDPGAFRTELRLSGEGPEVILVLTRVAGRPAVLAVEPVPAS